MLADSKWFCWFVFRVIIADKHQILCQWTNDLYSIIVMDWFYTGRNNGSFTWAHSTYVHFKKITPLDRIHLLVIGLIRWGVPAAYLTAYPTHIHCFLWFFTLVLNYSVVVTIHILPNLWGDLIIIFIPIPKHRQNGITVHVCVTKLFSNKVFLLP